MRRLCLAIASAFLLAGTAAQAQLIDGSGVASSSVTAGALPPIQVGPGAGFVLFNGNGGSFESTVVVNSDSITFDSGVGTSGPLSLTESSTSVDVTLTNITGSPLSVDSVHSEIVPAGLGFYLQDRTNDPIDGNIYLGFPQSLSGLTFADLPTDVPVGSPFASADFDFQITSGDTTLYSLSGSLSLSFNALGEVVVTNNLADAQAALDGFVTAYDMPSALAYAWDPTPVDLDLGWILAPGESQALNYLTHVSSFTRADCIDEVTCLVGYSGFGDPVGRGGGIQSFARVAAIDAFVPISRIQFNEVTVPFSFTITPIPEPSTWISLVAGFGLLGAALRRRRLPAHA